MRTTRARDHGAAVAPGMKLQVIERDQNHSPYIDGEPLFVVRARDNFALAVLLLLRDVYDVADSELQEWREWREKNARQMRDPGKMRGPF